MSEEVVTHESANTSHKDYGNLRNLQVFVYSEHQIGALVIDVKNLPFLVIVFNSQEDFGSLILECITSWSELILLSRGLNLIMPLVRFIESSSLPKSNPKTVPSESGIDLPCTCLKREIIFYHVLNNMTEAKETLVC